LVTKAIRVDFGGVTDEFGGVCKEVFPDGFVGVGAIGGSDSGFAGGDAAMCSFFVLFDIGVGDKSSGVLEWWSGRIYVDDGSEGL